VIEKRLAIAAWINVSANVSVSVSVRLEMQMSPTWDLAEYDEASVFVPCCPCGRWTCQIRRWFQETSEISEIVHVTSDMA
jgi:hypothetical protein